MTARKIIFPFWSRISDGLLSQPGFKEAAKPATEGLNVAIASGCMTKIVSPLVPKNLARC